MAQRNNLGFDEHETRILKQLSSPRKIQDFLESIPINKEKDGDTCMSPRLVLRTRRAHCIEGAFLAAAALWFHGEEPLVFDLKADPYDYDHVVAPFRMNGHWGAISKTNHAVLRYRDPVYKTLRELALSYFHEYTDDEGRKTLRSFSKTPLNLKKFSQSAWTVSENGLWHIQKALDRAPHVQILAKAHILRPADSIEIKAGKLTEW